ncbi:hypothetical protein VNO80_21216 [Phaseolus coccineus]|uniref:Uncharacterized protein n=1 Tax=Phaseolus coccineus TaxID=3886 RepID=A0AAN9M7C2_PHACN
MFWIYYHGLRKFGILDTAETVHWWNPPQLEGPTTYAKHCASEGNAGEYICQCRCHTELILHERSKPEAPVLKERIMSNRVKPPYMTKYGGGTALGLVINGHSMEEVIFIHSYNTSLCLCFLPRTITLFKCGVGPVTSDMGERLLTTMWKSKNGGRVSRGEDSRHYLKPVSPYRIGYHM